MTEWIAVSDAVGTIRGFVDRELLLHSNPLEPVPAPGYPVLDGDSKLAGYIISGGGFIDLQTAADPALLRALTENPNQVVDAEGKLVSSPEEWHRRLRDSTAAVR